MKLFKNEKLNFKNTKTNNVQVAKADEDINQKYIKGEVRIVTEQARYPLPAIPDMVNSDKYKLNPEYQRRHRWNKTQQSRLIESFIMNVPVPPIFLYEYKYAYFEVMDGQQRLTAISNFYKNELILEGLDEWPELNGRRYDELPERIKDGVDRRYLSSIILLQETAKSEIEAERLKQKVFERINTGGVSLAPQESRNAIYNGPLNNLCIKLSENDFLRKLWRFPTENEITRVGIPENKKSGYALYRQMFDVELVLRFFAYRQRPSADAGTLQDYLDRYLQLGNRHFSEGVLSRLENLFTETIKLVYHVLGQKAFWLYRERQGKWYWLKRPTLVVYDPLMNVFSQYIDRAEVLIEHKKEFRKGIEGFYQTNYEHFGGRSVGQKYQEKRIELLTEFIEDVIGSERES